MDVDAIVFLLIPLLASIILSAASIILSAEGHGLLYQLSPVLSCAIPACLRLCSLPISINDGTYNVTIYFSVIFHYES